MKLRTLLELARVSNLPTVWSNVLAGAVLAGRIDMGPVVAAGLAGSLLYSGGMFLNDAFDAEIDARERPERPIPSGRIAKRTVLVLGLGMLGLALAVLGAFAAASEAGVELVATGLAVAGGVLVYDRFHKGIAWSPLVMGFCRAGLYVLGAFAIGASAGKNVLLPAASLLLYVVGLTHVARFENASVVGRVWPVLAVFAPALLVLVTSDFARASSTHTATLAGVLVLHLAWTLRALAVALRGGKGAIPRAVVALIAGISLVDAAFVAAGATDAVVALLVALASFALTLLFQRWVRGT
jgi:4-hydroxybenzoate polyprenyltransferase